MAPKQFIRVLKPVEVRQDDKWARFDPYDGFKVSFKIDFDHPVFSSHTSFAAVDFSTTSYLKEISRARTFGFMRDLEMLRKNLFEWHTDRRGIAHQARAVVGHSSVRDILGHTDSLL